MLRLAFLQNPSGSPGKDESRRSDPRGSEMSKEVVAKPNWETGNRLVSRVEGVDLNIPWRQNEEDLAKGC